MSKSTTVGLIAALTLVASNAYLATTNGDLSPWPRLADDAFYYFAIADNFWRGWGLSMDGIHVTNGFQPLWMVICLGIFNPLINPTTTGIALVSVIGLGLFATIASRTHDITARIAGPWAGLAAAAMLLFPRFLWRVNSGMESAITVLFGLLVFQDLVRQNPWDRPTWSKQDARSGLLLAMLMLSRLDSVWILFAAAAWIGLQGLGRQGTLAERLLQTFLKGVSVFWPVLVLVIPFLAWNHSLFGHIVPISGVLKSSYPEIGPYWGGLRQNIEFVALFGLGCLGALAAWLQGHRDRTLAVQGVFLVGTAVHLLHTLLYMNWAVLPTHFVVLLVPGAVGLTMIWRALPSRLDPLQAPMVAAWTLAMVAALGWSTTKPDAGFTQATIVAGEWADEHLPEDAILGMKDSGAFSFYSRRPVVNLDGIINGLTYQEALCSGQLAPFLEAAGVDFLVQHVTPEPGYGAYEQDYPCHLHGGQPATLPLTEADEIYRGPLYPGWWPPTSVVIWHAPWSAARPTLTSQEGR